MIVFDLKQMDSAKLRSNSKNIMGREGMHFKGRRKGPYGGFHRDVNATGTDAGTETIEMHDLSGRDANKKNAQPLQEEEDEDEI